MNACVGKVCTHLKASKHYIIYFDGSAVCTRTNDIVYFFFVNSFAYLFLDSIEDAEVDSLIS